MENEHLVHLGQRFAALLDSPGRDGISKENFGVAFASLFQSINQRVNGEWTSDPVVLSDAMFRYENHDVMNRAPLNAIEDADNLLREQVSAAKVAMDIPPTQSLHREPMIGGLQ